MEKYTVEARRAALQLMYATLETSGLDQAYLGDKLDEGMRVVAVNRYPRRSQRYSTLGLAPHSGYGCITILLQSCEGLKMFDKDIKSLRAVPGVPEALHVHIGGDHLKTLSNGPYKSLKHQAVLDSQKRIPIASIHGFSMDEKVTTPKELVDGQHPKRYRDGSFRDFLNCISTTEFIIGRSFIAATRYIDAA